MTNYKHQVIKSPLNYIGGKYKLLSQIIPLFPSKINRFVDIFAGGCNVGINVNADKVYFNDNLVFLIEMYKAFKKNTLDDTITHLEEQINKYSLSLTNEEGYKKIRYDYNQKKVALDLFVLTAYSFNHQIRFNNKHEFNTPFGRNRSSFNLSMKQNLEKFINKLKTIEAEFTSQSFEDLKFSSLDNQDFVYFDPPYLITTGTYNDGKRGFKGWSAKEEKRLFEIMDFLDQKKVKFALSNVIEHKGNSNELLKDWIRNNKNLQINYIDSNYNNSNYQIKEKAIYKTTEVLITNYEVDCKLANQPDLFTNN